MRKSCALLLFAISCCALRAEDMAPSATPHGEAPVSVLEGNRKLHEEMIEELRQDFVRITTQPKYKELPPFASLFSNDKAAGDRMANRMKRIGDYDGTIALLKEQAAIAKRERDVAVEETKKQVALKKQAQVEAEQFVAIRDAARRDADAAQKRAAEAELKVAKENDRLAALQGRVSTVASRLNQVDLILGDIGTGGVRADGSRPGFTSSTGVGSGSAGVKVENYTSSR